MIRWISCLAALAFSLSPNSSFSQIDTSRNKISPELRAQISVPSEARHPVTIICSQDTEPPKYLKQIQVMDVAGMRLIRGFLTSREILKAASDPGVEGIFDFGPRTPPSPPDPDVPGIQRKLPGHEEFQKALKQAPPFSEAKKLVEEVSIKENKDWWIKNPLGLEEAWSLGIKGAGVKIAIIDTGVDFANPDLLGTQARDLNPASPHYGWPICFDDRSLSTYYMSHTTEGTWFVDTSSTPPVTINGGVGTANFAIYHGDQTETHTYTFNAESVSGIYRFGIHPDTKLKKDVLNDYSAAVLLVDHPNTAQRGVGYNTVYVDLDGDYDFTDEKPCFRGSEISFRDIWDSAANTAGSDGYPDVSGGMVYFIANGVRNIPTADWLYQASPPANGSLVAFMINDKNERGGNHGTFCASAAVARGIINGGAPGIKPPFQGPGDGMVQGPAPEAKIIAVGNYYVGGTLANFHLFFALGYDGIENTGDEPNLVSMSYGAGDIDNDGWDPHSRLIDKMSLKAPQITWLKSTGNGAPGYSTCTTPSSFRAVTVGACTSYDTCDEYDSLTSTDQILHGDIQSWSGSGPTATGQIGVDVVAHGAWGGGDVTLNEAKDGWKAWDQWGGTSRSCPETAGVAALVCQAYKQANGVWPNSKAVRRILMSSAIDLNYDILRQGSGRIHAGRAVNLARQSKGIQVNPPSWVPGNFRGTEYPGYASLVYPGQAYQKTVDVWNQGAQPISLQVRDNQLEEFGHTDFEINTLATSAEKLDIRQPDYATLFHGPGKNPIPAGTDLIVFEAIYPFEDFDTNYQTGDPGSILPPRENSYRLLIYDWTDVNGNGKLFDDTRGSIPGLVEDGEMDAGEFMRFNYGYNNGTSLRAFVANPLSRYHHGIWVGIQHRKPVSTPVAVKIRIRATYFREVDCPWLQAGVNSLLIPPGQHGYIQLNATIPPNMPLGLYTAKLILQPDPLQQVTDSTVIPVMINVARTLENSNHLIHDVTESAGPFRNTFLSGDFSWEGREESGDGRFFFLDCKNPSSGDYLLTRTTWEDTLPTDIDTLIMGPEKDSFTTPGGPDYHTEFGPNTLVPVGGFRSPGRPNWRYQTASLSNSDYSLAPLTDGLHALFVQNVLFSGRRFEIPYQVEISKINIKPSPLKLYTATNNFVDSITVTSGISMDGFTGEAYGPSSASHYNFQSIQESQYYHATFGTDNLTGLIRVDVRSTAKDVDLYLYRDGADGTTPDGVYKNTELVMQSDSQGSSESIFYPFPVAGTYRAYVYTWAVDAPDDTIDMDIMVLKKNPGVVSPGAPHLQAGEVRTVGLSAYILTPPGEYKKQFLFLTLGPGSVPHALQLFIPIEFAPPGDANMNGIVDGLDAFSLAQHWLSQGDIPLAVDYDRDGKINSKDVLAFIKSAK
ncbi:MAG: S8 family serine peptidase [Candidatus Omnitrophica bacterium]|nr:S8 family serine peptidase [Candidatus Omnitrophota bacterium]